MGAGLLPATSSATDNSTLATKPCHAGNPAQIPTPSPRSLPSTPPRLRAISASAVGSRASPPPSTAPAPTSPAVPVAPPTPRSQDNSRAPSNPPPDAIGTSHGSKMACPVCMNKTVASCGYAGRSENHFTIVLSGDFRNRVYVPCNKKSRFDMRDQDSAELITREGVPFQISIKREPVNVTCLHGAGWTELARQYSFNEGDHIHFTMATGGQAIHLELRSEDNIIPKRPIFGTFFYTLNGAQREYVERMIWSEEAHPSVDEMDSIVLLLVEQGIGETKPWLHSMRKKDFKSFRALSRVGTQHLPQNSSCMLARHLGGPGERVVAIPGRYLIRPNAWRIKINEGWHEFLARNTDFGVGDQVMVTYKKYGDGCPPYLFIEKIPTEYGMCVKCQNPAPHYQH